MGNIGKTIMAILSTVWVVLALLLIFNPLIDQYWYWAENLFGFSFLALTVSIIQLRLKKFNLGMALSLGYFFLVLIVLVFELRQPSEDGWGWIGVAILGAPLTFFRNAPLIFDLTHLTGNQTIQDGLAYGLLGTLQYFLIGFFLEKTYRVVVLRFGRKRKGRV
ncbi:MAG TPA: hypothetical protein VHE12_11165 [bacterium]|nr:hypothetical protein [bacterium]